MDPEIASFIWKFQHFSSIGRNANLYLTTNNGKVSMNLSVDIGFLPSPPYGPIPEYQSTPTTKSFPSSRFRNEQFSNSKQKRLAKRAEQRRIFAKEATLNVSEDEKLVLKLAEKAEVEEKNKPLQVEVNESTVNELDERDAEEAGYAIFDLKVDAHKCCDSDIIEAIKENFFGNLKEKQIERSDPMGDLSVVAIQGLLEKEKVFRLRVNVHITITEIVEK